MMRMKWIWTITFCLIVLMKIAAQDTIPKMYWVELTDKLETPFSIWEPEAFLSPRAIERRNRQRIAITEQDLPVNPAYVNQVAATGAQIHNRSKWLNALTIIADSLTEIKVSQLPFVRSVEYVGKYIPQRYFLRKENKERDVFEDYPKQEDYYGYGSQQIGVLKGDVLHMLGHEGEGMMVAILDGGFTNVDIMPFYDSLRSHHLLYAGPDFVDTDDYVYESSSHGSQVLSVMGSRLPGLFVGTAPAATYLCIKTEDVRGEYLTEECNWVAAAEYADSIGADIINSSLGYTGFTDRSMNYSKDQLDGLHSRASRAGDIAFSKGMVVVNSAGNSGDDGWGTLGVPADGFDVFSIGAVRRDGSKAPFSSTGPTADGRIKPDVAAIGQAVSVASIYSYDVYLSNGTSFASPTIAGMIATLWSAFPDKSNEEILEAIRQSSSRSDAPDNQLGYGVPDFALAYHRLKTSGAYNSDGRFLMMEQELIIRSGIEGPIQLIFKDLYGRKLDEAELDKNLYQRLNYPLPEGLPAMFVLEIEAMGETFRIFHQRATPTLLIKP